MNDTTREPPDQRGPDARCLFDLASGQTGYFTARQAHTCGFSRSLLSHHARTGRFVRFQRGVYRLRDYPSSAREHVVAAWLAAGKDVAVVSHDSALDLLDLSDVIPDAVHLTVPRSQRSLPRIAGVKVHTTDRAIGPEDRWVRDGVVVTSAARSIVDAAERGADPDQVGLAVAQAIERGLASAAELRRTASARGRRVIELLERALTEAAA
jgi:predicted transcriptional regulator of viral defense system